MFSKSKQKDVSKIKNLREDHDLCVQNNAPLLTYLFESFHRKCTDICERGRATFVDQNQHDRHASKKNKGRIKIAE